MARRRRHHPGTATCTVRSGSPWASGTTTGTTHSASAPTASPGATLGTRTSASAPRAATRMAKNSPKTAMRSWSTFWSTGSLPSQPHGAHDSLVVLSESARATNVVTAATRTTGSRNRHSAIATVASRIPHPHQLGLDDRGPRVAGERDQRPAGRVRAEQVEQGRPRRCPC